MDTFTNLDPNNLVIFYFVATEKSLTSAADKLHLTQPAITYHIRLLEEYTRVKLIEFKKHQVILTPPGRELFKYAEEIFHQLANADRFIKSIRESNLRVGIASVYIATISQVLNRMFEEQLSDIRLRIESGDSLEIVQSVVDSKLDLALVPEFNYSNKKLKRITVSNPLKLVCYTAANQVIEKQPMEWSDLLNYPLVCGPETSVVRKMVTEKFENEGLEMNPLAAEVGSTEWCKTLVENGKGISFSLMADINDQVRNGQLKLVELKDYLYLTAQVVTRVDSYMNPNMQTFINMIRRSFQNYNYNDSDSEA